MPSRNWKVVVLPLEYCKAQLTKYLSLCNKDVIMGYGKVPGNVYRTHAGAPCFLDGCEFLDEVFAQFSHSTAASYL